MRRTATVLVSLDVELVVLPVVILYEVANGTDERQDKDDEEKQDLISLVTMSTVVVEVFLNLGPLNSSWVADAGTGSVSGGSAVTVQYTERKYLRT
jgi:hypothetical protein